METNGAAFIIDYEAFLVAPSGKLLPCNYPTQRIKNIDLNIQTTSYLAFLKKPTVAHDYVPTEMWPKTPSKKPKTAPNGGAQ